eukprot:CAMPEP_0204354658 /NCGR_PEP_ID=MMETSP0469-20131031/33566_1 /ASSEMBLY_ACC=CAM_ASM_000384 /TAXON_ID=2969 /ORGANISM="Oxyrrhis marina" /LENGTH=63 /DNA_ID=CAMNT_0051341787 /DNA_START=59 /DNA_END=250 /DNA_ORIENTATION=-
MAADDADTPERAARRSGIGTAAQPRTVQASKWVGEPCCSPGPARIQSSAEWRRKPDVDGLVRR